MPVPEHPVPGEAAAASRRADHTLIVAAAREAGEIAMGFFGGPIKSWYKAKDALVTEADIAVDDMLRARLCAARDDYGWLSEETRDDLSRLDRNRIFVVDPIDGTRGFAQGQPHFTICVAVVEAGRPTAAVVFNPAREELFDAIAGGGARLNGQTITPSRLTGLAGARVLGSRRLMKNPAFAAARPPVQIAYRNSIAYRLALVASGEFDATINLWGAHEWDLAAADLIVEEAGARLTNLAGEQHVYNRQNTRLANLVCAGPPLHALLLEELGKTARAETLAG